MGGPLSVVLLFSIAGVDTSKSQFFVIQTSVQKTDPIVMHPHLVKAIEFSLVAKSKGIAATQDTKAYIKRTTAEFKEFYPQYLSAHRDRRNKILHFCGTLLGLSSLGYVFEHGEWLFVWVPFVLGYGPAWIGHFCFEKNKPLAFKRPFLSFLGDVVMMWHLATGQLDFDSNSRLK